jgi:hypothetical protein
MDFQGQGTATDGMCQALGLIDTTSRFVVVTPLPNREATTLIQPFLDRVVFTHGPPVTLHSDAAPEFLDQLVKLVADATDTHTTNTLGHNAQGNAAIEIFWRFWNRCVRVLPDDLYLQWPSFTSRIARAYNSAPHASLGGISPFEIMHGVPARSPFDVAVQAAVLDAVLPTADLADPRAFADTIKVSVAALAVLTGVPPDPPFLLPFALPTARVGGCDIFFEVTFLPFFIWRGVPRNRLGALGVHHVAPQGGPALAADRHSWKVAVSLSIGPRAPREEP